jgi:hypothetical protein
MTSKILNYSLKNHWQENDTAPTTKKDTKKNGKLEKAP